jgi:hypothetical protein
LAFLGLAAGLTVALGVVGFDAAAVTSSGRPIAAVRMSATPAVCAPTWSDSASPPSPDARLLDVAAISADDVWAVGGTVRYGKWGDVVSASPLIEHWNGRHWTIVRAPRVRGDLLSVSAASARDVWAVGWHRSGGNDEGPLVLHWNGDRWSQVVMPAGIRGASAVTAVAPDDVWVVGSFAKGERSVGQIAHWNGRRWALITSLANTRLHGVKATSTDDAWAVGSTGDKALVLHWNGVRWQKSLVRAAPPDFNDRSITDFAWFSAVDATSPRDVWVGGAVSVESLLPPQQDSLLLHWNGRFWQAETRLKGSAVQGIAAVSQREIWAVELDANTYQFTRGAPGAVLHRSNGKWQTLRLASGGALYAITAVRAAAPGASPATGHTELWAVGMIGTGETEAQPFPAHTKPLIRRFDC